MNPKTQKQQLLQHMKRRPITTLEAMMKYKICRLSQRIIELEQDGYFIEHEFFKQNGKRYVRYHLVSSQRRAA